MQRSNSVSPRAALLIAMIAILVAVTMFGDRASPAFWQQLRMLSVALLTLAAMFYLIKGTLAAFSKFGGWKTASPSLHWFVALLMLAAAQLWKYSNPELTAGMSVVAGLVALSAVVMQQRQREQVKL